MIRTAVGTWDGFGRLRTNRSRVERAASGAVWRAGAVGRHGMPGHGVARQGFDLGRTSGEPDPPAGDAAAADAATTDVEDDAKMDAEPFHRLRQFGVRRIKSSSGQFDPVMPGPRLSLAEPDQIGRFGRQFGLSANRVAALAATFRNLRLGRRECGASCGPRKYGRPQRAASRRSRSGSGRRSAGSADGQASDRAAFSARCAVTGPVVLSPRGWAVCAARSRCPLARHLECRADHRRQTAARTQSHACRRHDLPLLPVVCSGNRRENSPPACFPTRLKSSEAATFPDGNSRLRLTHAPVFQIASRGGILRVGLGRFGLQRGSRQPFPRRTAPPAAAGRERQAPCGRVAEVRPCPPHGRSRAKSAACITPRNCTASAWPRIGRGHHSRR